MKNEKKGREIETYTLEFVADEQFLRNIETHISNFETLPHCNQPFAFACRQIHTYPKELRFLFLLLLMLRLLLFMSPSWLVENYAVVFFSGPTSGLNYQHEKQDDGMVL